MFYKGLIGLCLAGIPGFLFAASRAQVPSAAFEFKAVNSADINRNMPSQIVIPDKWSWAGTRRVNEDTAFYSHDRFRLEIHPRQSGHVYLFCRNSQGEFQLLYPQREDGDNYVNRNNTVTLPGNGWFRFDEEPGQEELILVQSAAPLVDIEETIDQDNHLDSVLLEKYDQWTARAIQNDWDGSDPGDVIVKRIFLRHEQR